MNMKITNVVIAGLGGQGVISASNLLAQAVFLAGYDVKKAEVHGMSQRGGSVSTDIRYGEHVLSPMVSSGEADALVLLDETQLDPNRHYLKPNGRLIAPSALAGVKLPTEKALNTALMGVLSITLKIPLTVWEQAIRDNFPERLHDINLQAFHAGRKAAKKE